MSRTGRLIEAALVRELREELGTAATVLGFVGAVEYGYCSDGRERRELNLVFDVEPGTGTPAGQEDHLEFSWIPMSELPRTELLPEPLKTGVQEWAENRTPFWRPLSP